MNKYFQTVCLLLAACSMVFASENGGYYTCNDEILAADNKCVFELTDTAPAGWGSAVTHDVDRGVGDAFYRGVESSDGSLLSVSPKPWVNGDVLAGTDDAVTGDDWNGYALIFELMAPLRDMMMYNPDALDAATWATWTRALTDCNAKTEDYVADRSGGTPFSTDQVYAYIKDPDYTDIHHFILQYLEEGTMDLVCLSTELEMEHCDTIRGTAGAVGGVDRCNCWFDAYAAIYGECPVVDMDFTTCSGTTAPTVCTDVVAVDTSELGGDGGDDTSGGEPGAKPDPTSKSRR